MTDIPRAVLRQARIALCELEPLLDIAGRLPPAAYAGLAAVQEAGVPVVLLTGRSAGWCDMAARLWPVDAVVGEHGAFWFARAGNRLVTRFARPDAILAAERAELAALAERVLDAVPGSDLASDQPYRRTDLAIDHSEDVPALPAAAVAEISRCLEAGGAHARIGPLHVHAAMVAPDRAAMLATLFDENFGLDLAATPCVTIDGMSDLAALAAALA